MTALILSGMDLTNLKQYSLLKRFQISQAPVSRSLGNAIIHKSTRSDQLGSIYRSNINM